MKNSNKTITCIIPAYNEEKSIGNILKVLSKISLNFIFEIIVINDCSIDKTEKIIRKFKNITLINNKENIGKSASVAKGLEIANGDYIFLLDSDLLNLKEKNILDFLEPILENKSEVVLGFVKNSWPLFPFKKIDYCTGIRLLKKEILLKKIELIKKLPSYGLEVFINDLIIKNNLNLEVVYWLNVENDFHQNRIGFIRGWINNFKIWKDIIFISGGIINIYIMNFKMKKLLKK